jgi:hypothetical protein
MDTIEAARRFIRSRLQNAFCKAMLKKTGNQDFWGPLESISSGIVENAGDTWHKAAKGIAVEDIRLAVLLAVAEAPKDFTDPYNSVLDKEVEEQVVSDFLQSFDPDEMQPSRGSS